MLAMGLAMVAGLQAGPGAATAATTAAAQTAPAQADGLDQMLTQLVNDIRAGNNAEAITYLDKLATGVKDRVGREKGPVFCAHSSAEAKGYLARSTPGSPPVQVLRPSLCEVLFLRAYVLGNLHRTSEATEQLRQLVALEPDFPHYQVEYGAALRESGDMDGAMAAYRRAVEIAAPVKEYALDQAGGLRGIGFVLTERGDLDGAEKAYRQSLELAPGHPLAMHELAYIAQLRAKGAKSPGQTFESNAIPDQVHLPDGWKAK